MINPSLAVNPVAAASPTGAVESPSSTAAGFDLAMAAAQAGTPTPAAPAAPDAVALPEVPADPASLSAVTGLLASAVLPEASLCASDGAIGKGRSPAPADPADDTADPAADGAAAILAQMLAGSSLAPRPAEPCAAQGAPQSELQAASLQPGRAPAKINVAAENARARGDSDADPDPANASRPGEQDLLDPASIIASAPSDLLEQADIAALLGKAAEPLASATSPASPSSASQAVQAAATALRDAVATPAPALQAPLHATLREPVGTARWADELGNRLVMMSVRGQQQGSLTLTPEHLGPVEVQISVSRDTANVWFGAQHADTRAALADAMPRLRELLASSGLSLGQSGVSEHAPREGFTSSPSMAADPASSDADPLIEPATPAWRTWRPGFIDTYV